jgi:hypothetical protein
LLQLQLMLMLIPKMLMTMMMMMTMMTMMMMMTKMPMMMLLLTLIPMHMQLQTLPRLLILELPQQSSNQIPPSATLPRPLPLISGQEGAVSGWQPERLLHSSRSS